MIWRWILVFTTFQQVVPLHLTGLWDESEFFKFLVKFAFQKTVLDDIEATSGYIYGNVTDLAKSNLSSPTGTLILLDAEHFLHLYSNANHLPRDEACQWMFAKVSSLAWHPTCNPKGPGDLIRSVPCKTVCKEEKGDVNALIKSNQFTYNIRDMKQPRYWYLSLVGCQRDPVTCQWLATDKFRKQSSRDASQSAATNQRIKYDIWLVNGSPHLKHYNRFEHQFSFDDHDTLELFLVFTILYLMAALFVQIKLCTDSNRDTVIVGLLASNLWLECIGSGIIFLHLLVFSSNGRGYPHLRTLGSFLRQWADCVLLILLVTLGEHGCRPKHLVKSLLVFILVVIVLLFSGLYLWAVMDENPVLDLLVYDTVPGCLLIATRFIIIFWFLKSVKDFQESEIAPGVEMLHFGAGFLLWFLSFPLTVLIAETTVSSLWREKFILSFSYCSNFVASSSLCYIVWISCRSKINNMRYHHHYSMAER